MDEHPVLNLIRRKLANPAEPFIIVAELEAQPGRGDDVAAAIANSRAIELTRREAGCLAYEICRDAEAPDRFLAHECWRDLEALADHLATAHFAAVGAAVGGLLSAAPSLRVLHPLIGGRGTDP